MQATVLHAAAPWRHFCGGPHRRAAACLAILVGLASLLAAERGLAAGPRVLTADKQPADARLAPPKDLNGDFPFSVPSTAEEWAARASRVRQQIALSQGLWPMPPRTPLAAVVHGLIDQGDYTVEKVYFQSVPGFFVTGNLYRPKGRSGRVPGVLFPHGHFNYGRFIDIGRQAVRREIVAGSERFENGGRSLLQALPVQVARMGCVCFHYDMIGYADSQQLSFQLAHRFAQQRPEMTSPESWGLFSPQAESYLQSIMGLQTWNSFRALDFLLSLPDVDPGRIAVTGASGGGTQTMLLAALDSRVSLAFPAVMVSTAMQGGCTCENACYLRIDTGNVEFAALFAPKPQGMTAANDWTKEMATKGFPELAALYRLLGAPQQQVQLFAFTHFPHNYNYVSRSAFYNFLNKHFRLGLEEPVVEEDYPRLTREQLTVWDAAHPAPPGGEAFERALCRQLAETARQQLDELSPRDAPSLANWRGVMQPAADVILGRGLPASRDLEFEKTHENATGWGLMFAGLLRHKPHREELPVVFLLPQPWHGRTVIWLSGQGKAGLFDADGSVAAAVRPLVDAGMAVAGIDLLLQGEFLPPGSGPAKNRPVNNPRQFAGYTYGYNRPLVVQRAHDVLSLIAFMRHHEQKPRTVELVAQDDTAPIAALALTAARGSVDRVALDTRGFRFLHVNDYLDASFLPGGAKYGDLPAWIALAAPTPLWLAGETPATASIVAAVYAACGSAPTLVWASPAQEPAAAQAVRWLLEAR